MRPLPPDFPITPTHHRCLFSTLTQLHWLSHLFPGLHEFWGLSSVISTPAPPSSPLSRPCLLLAQISMAEMPFDRTHRPIQRAPLSLLGTSPPAPSCLHFPSFPSKPEPVNQALNHCLAKAVPFLTVLSLCLPAPVLLSRVRDSYTPGQTGTSSHEFGHCQPWAVVALLFGLLPFRLLLVTVAKLIHSSNI